MATTKTELLINGSVVDEKTSAPFLPFNYDTAGLSGNVTVAVREYIDGELAGTTPAVSGTVTESSGTTFETEYQAWLDYGTANGYELPSSTQQEIDNARVANLKTAGAWSGLDVFWFSDAVYSPTSFDVNIYRVNLINPGDYTLYQDTPAAVPDWVSGEGFYAPSGSNKFLKTGFNPAIDAVNMTNNSKSFTWKTFNAPTTFDSSILIAGGRVANDNDQILIGNNSSGNLLTRLSFIGEDSNNTITQSNVNNHFQITVDGNEKRLYREGVNADGTGIDISAFKGALPNIEQYLLAYNDNGTPSFSSDDVGISYAAFGAHLRVEQLAIYEIMNGTY